MKSTILLLAIVAVFAPSYAKSDIDTTKLKYIRFLEIGSTSMANKNSPLTISFDTIDRKIKLKRFQSIPKSLLGVDIDSLNERFAIIDKISYAKLLNYLMISSLLKNHKKELTDDIWPTFEIIIDNRTQYFLPN